MMATLVRYSCYGCAAFIALIPIRASAQGGVIDSKPVTMTATIEAVDKANRTVTLKGPKGNSLEVKVEEQMEGFNRLKVGDQVSATYVEYAPDQRRTATSEGLMCWPLRRLAAASADRGWMSL